MLSKTEQLFIRACKSQNPNKRVRSVYKRRYIRYVGNISIPLTSILAGIAEEYLKLHITALLDNLSPDKYWYYGHDPQKDTYYDLCVKVLIAEIRNTSADKFPNLSQPTWSKKLYANNSQQ